MHIIPVIIPIITRTSITIKFHFYTDLFGYLTKNLVFLNLILSRIFVTTRRELLRKVHSTEKKMIMIGDNALRIKVEPKQKPVPYLKTQNMYTLHII